MKGTCGNTEPPSITLMVTPTMNAEWRDRMRRAYNDNQSSSGSFVGGTRSLETWVVDLSLRIASQKKLIVARKSFKRCDEKNPRRCWQPITWKGLPISGGNL